MAATGATVGMWAHQAGGAIPTPFGMVNSRNFLLVRKIRMQRDMILSMIRQAQAHE